jgi:hypothetical protein
MKVITLEKTKELLGITDSASDAAITAKIPYIDSLVKQITKNRFNYAVYGTMTTGSATVYIRSIITWDGNVYNYSNGRYFCSGINNYICYDDIGEYLQTGQQIEGTGIPAETYIDEVYYNGNVDTFNGDESVPYITMSNVATADSDDGKIYIGMNIAYQTTVAKGIQYLINGTSTTLPTNALSSKSIGPVSKSFSSSDQKIDNRYGMPAWFVKAFPRYQRGY